MYKILAVFVLYGLLSVASITLAQLGTGGSPNDCPLSPIPSNGKITIGYVQLGNTIDNFKTIRWDYYDYINVIGKKKNLSFRIN